MAENLIGIDIGGTKCAVIYGRLENGNLEIVQKERFPTDGLGGTLKKIASTIREVMASNGLTAENTASIGISCGGPLDSKKGVVMSPPNLPGWDCVPVAEMISKEFGISAYLENDANACALAEWKFGAGRGCDNMVFMTFGTGLGAGLIIDGKLYAGTNGNAGELGHIRLSDFGPVGYGKGGSFEGFCSGGGIAQLARSMACEKLQMGQQVSFCPTHEDLPLITAQSVAAAAFAGDELAREVYAVSGRFLGKGLSVVIDMLNPEVIVIGSIFARCRELLEPSMYEALSVDALSISADVCRIVPAQLDEHIGDYAALSVAADNIFPTETVKK